MNIEKYTTQSCCGKKSTIYQLDKPITIDFLNSLKKLGFKELTHFTEAGILYLDNSEFILTGPIGSNRLQIKCKKSNCNLDFIESKIKNI